MVESLSALHTARHAVLGEARGRPVPLGYGDFAGEVEALGSGVGVLDLSACGVIGVGGRDAALFLNGLLTNNVKTLGLGRAQENLLCATKGKILHAVLLVRTKEEEFLVVTEPGELEAVAAHLDGYHVREELRMGVVPLARLDVLGARAEAALSGLGFALAAPGHFVPNRGGGAPVLTLALPMAALPRQVLLLPAPAAAALAQALLDRAAARLVGLEAWDEARIWAGWPRFGTDYSPDHLPAEAALYTHIAFDKGCYVGQEIHARMHYRGHPNRKLVTVDLAEAATQGLAAGSPLYHGGQPAGHLTSLARLARDGRRRGIALIPYPLAADRTALATTAQGPAEVAVSPLATDLGAAQR